MSTFEALHSHMRSASMDEVQIDLHFLFCFHMSSTQVYTIPRLPRNIEAARPSSDLHKAHREQIAYPQPLQLIQTEFFETKLTSETLPGTDSPEAEQLISLIKPRRSANGRNVDPPQTAFSPPDLPAVQHKPKKKRKKGLRLSSERRKRSRNQHSYPPADKKPRKEQEQEQEEEEVCAESDADEEEVVIAPPPQSPIHKSGDCVLLKSYELFNWFSYEFEKLLPLHEEMQEALFAENQSRKSIIVPLGYAGREIELKVSPAEGVIALSVRNASNEEKQQLFYELLLDMMVFRIFDQPQPFRVCCLASGHSIHCANLYVNEIRQRLLPLNWEKFTKLEKILLPYTASLMESERKRKRLGIVVHTHRTGWKFEVVHHL